MLRRPGTWFAGAAAVLCAPILAAVVPVPAAATDPAVAVTSSTAWPETVGTTTFLHLVGEVLNSGGTAANIQVTVSLKALDGHEVGSDTVFAKATLLAQGERAPFEAVVPEPALYDHFTTAVTAVPAIATPAHQFAFTLDACHNQDPTSAPCQSAVPQDVITGTVRNDNGVTVDNVVAVFTFLDGGGNVVAENSAMVPSGNPLTASSSGDFTIDRSGEPAWVSFRFFGETDYPVDLNPSSLDFGNQLLGTTSVAQTITVFNGAPRTVNVTQVSASGDFGKTTNCAAVLSGSSCWINVTFAPTAMGPRAGTLTVTDDAAGTPRAIPLTGTGIAPIASLSTDQLDFGQVNVGANAQLPVTLSNIGTAPLVINSVGTTGDYTADASACPAAVDPKANCIINITFAPKQAYDRPGVLSIGDSAAGSPHTVQLTGVGYGPGVGLSPTSVAFGNQSLGVSKNKTVTVTNTGNAGLIIQSITPPAGIGEKDTCVSTTFVPVASLPPNATCIVTLTFFPQQPGAVNGNIVLVDNAADSPQQLAVSGTGVTPLQLDPTALRFGTVLVGGSSAGQTVTLTNTGSESIGVTSVATAAPFKVTGNTCGFALVSNAQCTITVQFAPDAAGLQNGLLSITDTAAGSPHTVQLSGTGVAPRWQSLGGVIPAGAAASSWGPSRIDIFVRGTDQFLWHRSFDGTSWSNWERLGGPIASDPAAVSWGLNHIDVFLKGTDGHPWQATFDSGQWSWTQLDGLLGSTPSVVSWAPGHLDLFTRGTDGQMWQNTFDSGQWSDWHPLGGVLDTEPAADTSGVGVIDVFVKGTDNRLWQNDFSGGIWHDWQPFTDGVLASVPAGTSPAAGRIDLFVRGTDGRLWHKTFVSGSWRNWTDADDFGGVITSKPGAVARGSQLEVFARGTDQALWWLQLGIR